MSGEIPESDRRPCEHCSGAGRRTVFSPLGERFVIRCLDCAGRGYVCLLCGESADRCEGEHKSAADFPTANRPNP